MYKIGNRVIVIDNNNASGSITRIDKFGPITHIGVMLDSKQFVTTIDANIRLEIVNPDPFDLLKQANFQTKEIFVVGGVMNKMFGNSNDIIATLKSSKTTFLPYQFKPLNKFLKSDNRRILIADEVGLGKTIEAGYILAELSLRGQVENCLIICKSSLKVKWQTELKEKFGFNFKIQNRKELISSIEEDNQNGTRTIYSIINYDYKKTGSKALIDLVEFNEYLFDMLIVDEAHILRNETTTKHGAVKKLVDLSKNTVFLTATPVMTSLRNLYNLVKIIEPKYDDYKFGFKEKDKKKKDFGYSLFNDHLVLSQPFIEAINKLSKGINPKEIINDLLEKEIELKYSLLDGTFDESSLMKVKLSERFANDELFESTIRMGKIEKFTYADIAILQKKLTELNSFQDIITRTRRREIQTNINNVTRRAEKIKVYFSDIEMELYESIVNDYEGNPLALVQKKREATSCLPAFISKHNLENENTEQIIKNDSKFKALEKIINKVIDEKNKKIIIFSFFKGTLKYLENKFLERGIPTLKIDGDIKIDNRQAVINKFESDNDIKILLSSEVGSEGLDMQFCDVMVNYDLPWNPMVVEQRIGRIDRIGQKSEIIYIYNLSIANTIEEQIFERLFDRIKIFNESIGSLEDILSSECNLFETIGSKDQSEITKLESEIYGYQLSQQGLQDKIRAIETAIEHVELLRKEIETDLDESFLNDQYITDEISKINNQKRYITSEDIISLLTLLFQTRLAHLRCDFTSSKPYIRFNEGQSGLYDFIEANIPTRRLNPQLYNKYLDFKRRNLNKSLINLTFNQEEAYENKLIEFISPTHPLAQAAFHFFRIKNIVSNNAFCFCIDYENVPTLNEASFYVLAKYNMESLKYTMAKDEPEISFFELQLVFKLNEEGEFVLTTDDIKNTILGVDLKFWYTNSNEIPTEEDCEEITNILSPVLMHEFYTQKTALEADLKAIHNSRQFRLIDTEVDFLRRQIESNKRTIQNNPDNSIRFIYNKENEQYQKKINQLLNQKLSISFSLLGNLQSLTIIKII